jgi:hypothetical protein
VFAYTSTVRDGLMYPKPSAHFPMVRVRNQPIWVDRTRSWHVLDLSRWIQSIGFEWQLAILFLQYPAGELLVHPKDNFILLLILIFTQYRFDGLDPGNHNVTLTNLGSSGATSHLDLGYVVIYRNHTSTAISPTNSTKDTPTSTAQKGSALSQPKHTGAIAGAAVGGVIFLAFLGFALWWCRRRRPKRAHISTPDLLAPPVSENEAAAVPIAL